jgi:S-DNA-T family DNA segregation ATPase FtsK/SpoIIIE
MVEMTMYGSLPHLLIPVVTEPKKAASSLRWAVREMERRYKAFSEVGARHMDRYNERVKEKGEHLPRIVIIIDELADLMMIAPDEVEDSIRRIAQLGRAAGIHLILATQRPDATVITGLIKANIPSRAAFAVSSATNSRIILDMGGAEKLLGHGDMLFHPDGSAKPTRLQCAYVSDEEVERIVAHFRAQTQHPVFDEQILEDVTKIEKSGPTGGAFGEGKQEDELLGEAVRVVLEHGQASTSMIQRRLRVGYSRASRLIDMMEQKGYISGFNGSKPRDVIIKKAQYLELFGDETPVADPPKREPNPIGEFYKDAD